MPAGRADLYIEKGAEFSITLQWKVQTNPDVFKDLTGWTARAQIRNKAGDPDPPILSRTTAAGNIVLGGVLGTINITATNVETDALPLLKGAGHWDLEMIDPAGKVTRLIEGLVFIKAEVTV